MSVADEVREIAKKYLHRVKTSGNDQIMALCPFHDNRNTPSFTMSLSKGLYYCFSCCEAGNLQMFLQNVGVTRNVIERQYKDVIEATRKHRPSKDTALNPFRGLRGKKTSHSRSRSSGSSTRSFPTFGCSRRGWTPGLGRSSTSAST